jgi:hypothetical protein
VALPYRIHPKEACHIKTRKLDDLPDHVKRNTDLEPDDPKGAEWNRKEKCYTAELYFNTEGQTPGYQTRVVEFIKNTNTGEDNWYLLIYQETVRNPGYYTSGEGKLIINGPHGLGWWDQFDQHHPSHPGNKGKQIAGPSEEIISGGLHHIVTTQGSHPLREETPPVILPAIEQSASQGEEIPIDIQPLAATSYETIQKEEPTMTTEINVTRIPPPPAEPGNGGGLVGTPPMIFSGDRNKAQTFLDSFRGWRAVNYKKEVMKDPYMRTALVLTFIKGEDVNSWATHQLKLLDEKIARGRANEEPLWDEFETNFKNAFTPIKAKENALAQLETLKMQRHELDKYIATFNRLLDDAGFNKKDKGVVEMFKRGLNVGLKVACIKRKPKPVTMDEWQEAAFEEQGDFLEVQHALGRNPYNIKGAILQNLKEGQKPTKFWKAKGPNAMEVDAVQTEGAEINTFNTKGGNQKPKAPLTDEEKQALRTLKLCFYCRQGGHISENCEKKKQRFGQDRRALPGQPVRPLPQNFQKSTPKIRSAEIEGERIMLNKENFREMIQNLDEEDRASVVTELLDF